MGRGVAWTSKDDVLLCEAWLDVSQDPLAATDQKMSIFWDKIMKYIRTNKGTIRTVRSSQSRFQFISAAVQKFSGVYSQQESSAASGTNDMDVERAAMEVYRVESPGGKSFDYRECWLKLKDYPKWESKGRGPQLEQEMPEDANPGSSSVPVDPPQTPSSTNSESNVVRGRPIGVKKTKFINQQSADLKGQLEAVASSNVLAAKRARILQQQVALGYFRLNTNDVPIELRDRFERTRDKLLNDLDANLDQAAPESNAPPQSQGNLYAASPAATVATEHDVEGVDDTTGEEHVPENHNGEYMSQNHTAYYAGYADVNEGFAAGSPDLQQTSHQPPHYTRMDEFDLRIGM